MFDIFNVICWISIVVGLILIGSIVKEQKDLIEANEHRKCTLKDYAEIIANLYKGYEIYYEEESK